MMSTYKIVTNGSVQRVVKEDGTEVTWLDDEYRTWLGQGNMPDTVIEDEL